MELTSPSFLQLFWFILIAVLWTGYLVLEGFDFGVGILTRFLAKNENERRLAINTIGPVWDGNEVWLLTAGGATFAAFPEWYASMFSGFYLALFLVLLALIARGMAFEYRGKVNSAKWRAIWDNCIFWGSLLPSILLGVAFGNLVHGVKLAHVEGGTGTSIQYVGNFFDLLNPFSIFTGICTLGIFLMHGAIYLSLKTHGEFQKRAAGLAKKLAIGETLIAATWALWLQFGYSHSGSWQRIEGTAGPHGMQYVTDGSMRWLSLIPLVVAALSLVTVVFMTMKERNGWSFFFSALAILSAVALIFFALFPNVMPTTIPAADGGLSLNIINASSTPYTLKVMSWVAVVLTPVVLAYQAWTYWVFRKRLSVANIPPANGLDPAIKDPAGLSV